MSSFIDCPQFVFGKIISGPTGTVAAGHDHKCTGRSIDFPKVLEGYCHPAKTGLLFEEGFNWEMYPWLSEWGGIICRPITLPGEAWLLVGRIMQFPENGISNLKSVGRKFTESHYAAIPVTAWRPEYIYDLWRQLNPKPLESEDYQMPLLRVGANPDNELLIQDWEKGIGIWLKQLLSSQPISIQDRQASVEKIVQLFQQCFCSLPLDLSWRIPWGAGLINMDGTIALAHGLRATAGPRLWEGNLRGGEGLDLSFGNEYVNYLREQIKEARSLKDVRDILEDLFPDFKQATPVTNQLDWRAVAREIGGRVAEKARLRKFRVAESNAKFALADIVYYRDEALKIALERFDKDGFGNLTATTTPAWRPVWENIVQGDDSIERSIAQALGILPLTSSHCAALVRNYNLPPDFEKHFIARICEAVSKSVDPDEWIELLKPQEKDAQWVPKWSTTAGVELTWLAYGNRGENLLGLLTDRDLDILESGLRSSGEDPSTLILTFAHAASRKNTETVLKIAGRLYQNRPRDYCTLLEASRQMHNPESMADIVGTLLGKDQEPDNNFLDRLSRNLVDLKCAVPASAVPWLLKRWNIVPAECQTPLSQSLAHVIGQPFANIFLGISIGIESKDKWRTLCLDVMASRLNSDVDYWLTLAEFVAGIRQNPSEITCLLIKFLEGTDSARFSAFPACVALAQFLQKRPLSDIKAWTEKDFNLFTAVKSCFGYVEDINSIKNRVERLDSAEEMAWALKCIVPQNLNIQLTIKQAVAILDYVAGNPKNAVQWEKTISERSWQKSLFWQIIYFAVVPKYQSSSPGDFLTLSPAEQTTILTLSQEAKLLLFRRDYNLVYPPCCNLTGEMIYALKLDDQFIEGLLNLCEKKEWSFISRQIGRFLVYREIVENKVEARAMLGKMEDYVNAGVLDKVLDFFGKKPNLIARILRQDPRPKECLKAWLNEDKLNVEETEK